MATKQCLCNTCNRTFLEDEEGVCPYCGSAEIEVVGETNEPMDKPFQQMTPDELADWLVYL